MKKQHIALQQYLACLCSLAPLALADDAAAPAPAQPDAAPAAASQQLPTPTQEQILKVVSYYLGYDTGMQLSGVGPLHIEDIDPQVFVSALADGLKGKVSAEMNAMNRDVLRACMMTFSGKLEARQKELARNNLAAAKAFLEENAKKEGVKTTKSGLQYKVLTPVEGGEKYDEKKHGKDARLMVTYEGRLADGTVFDKAETPVPFQLTGVIPGVAEALGLMPIGEEWEVYVPAELGYGEQAPAQLGPNALLIFKFKLHGIEKAEAPAPGAMQLTPEMIEQIKAAGMPTENNADAEKK